MGKGEVGMGCGPQKKTPEQLEFLERMYSEDKCPKQKDMKDCAESIGLMYIQVRKWFTDRRRKEKRDRSSVTGENVNRNGETNGSRAASKGLPTHGKVFGLKKSVMMGKRNSTRASHGHTQLANLNRLKSPTYQMLKSMAGRQSVRHRKSSAPLQVLYSREYILQRVFRKDGPPLGVEFDPLPARSFGCHAGSTGPGNLSRPYCGIQGGTKKRKVPEPSIPTRGYGIGKGLMTVWHATNPNSRTLPRIPDFSGKITSKTMPTSGHKVKKSTCRQSNSNVLQRRNLVVKQRAMRHKLQKKQKPPVKKRKVLDHKVSSKVSFHTKECKLAVEGNKLQELDMSLELIDDEELELSELQVGPNPLRCSAHITSNGRNDCPLCKDMLSRFPPEAVKIKQTLQTRPWICSPAIVKKLFSVFKFLYTHAVKINICPFTLDEFEEGFRNKDSLLLGKIHVALLKLVLTNVEQETSGFLPRASKHCRYLAFLHLVKQQNLDVSFWVQSLNSMTWVEIMRQVLIAAGFGTKTYPMKRGCHNEEANLMLKYGLRPHTLKGELFSILSEEGSRGSSVSELSKASQILSLGLQNKDDELRHLICSVLSSDVTLFEKIGSSTFRSRNTAAKKDPCDSDSENGDSGSIDNDFEGSNLCSSSDEYETSEGLNSALCAQGARNCRIQNRKSKTSTKHIEIDESFSGEAWVLGLMESEYCNLSIEEKLDALVALVELSSSVSSLRMEEPTRDTSKTVCDPRYHGSGAKIKKSVARNDMVSRLGYGHTVGFEEASENRRMVNPGPVVGSGTCVNPLKSIYLGSDRRYNNYWLFLGPCNITDPGHRRVYFESSDDGNWGVISTGKDLSSLISALDGRGTREARLLVSLKKLEPYLWYAMSNVMENDHGTVSGVCDSPVTDVTSGEGSTPVSDVDNNVVFEEMSDGCMDSTTVAVECRKHREGKSPQPDELQAFDKWIWESFYGNLNAVKLRKKSYHESLAHCDKCNDLFWRDEKHCKKCHVTFELDFDLEERYAIHVATCREVEVNTMPHSTKALPTQLQALKAAIHAIEVAMPKEALMGAWKKSSQKVWGRRLQRTSSLPELLQVVADFVAAINEDWLYETPASLSNTSIVDDIITLFQSIPQTVSAVALWMIKLDAQIASHLLKV